MGLEFREEVRPTDRTTKSSEWAATEVLSLKDIPGVLNLGLEKPTVLHTTPLEPSAMSYDISIICGHAVCS